MSVTQAIIVCGGFGKRLGDITLKTPKPMLKIKELTVLEYIIKNLSRFGIKKVFLLCHYKYSLFKKKFHNKIFFSVEVFCVKEKKLLGSSGALFNIRKKLDKNFLFCNGDTFFDINISDLIYEHVRSEKLAFVALKKIKTKYNYDTFNLDNKNSLLQDFNNKSKMINSGIYILSKKIIPYLVKLGSLEKNVFIKLIKKKKISGKVYDREFLDMGRPSTFKKLPKFIDKIFTKPALFLDRDGVINKDTGYVFRKEKFIWRKNIINFIKNHNKKNFYVFVVTNQSGVGRGYYSEKDVNNLHDWMIKQIRSYGANIDKVYFAPYYKNSNFKKYRLQKNMRKPQIGTFLKAQKEFSLNLKKCYMIGDSETDLEFADNCKIKGYKLNFSDDIIKLSSRLN